MSVRKGHEAEVSVFVYAIIVANREADEGIVGAEIFCDLIGIKLIFLLTFFKGDSAVLIPCFEILACGNAHMTKPIRTRTSPVEFILTLRCVEGAVIEEILLGFFVPKNDVVGIEGALNVQIVLLLEVVAVFACEINELCTAVVEPEIDLAKCLELFFLGAVGVGVIKNGEIINGLFARKYDVVVFCAVVFVFSDVGLTECQTAVAAFRNADRRFAGGGSLIDSLTEGISSIIDAVSVADLDDGCVTVVRTFPFVITDECEVFLFGLMGEDLNAVIGFHPFFVPA